MAKRSIQFVRSQYGFPLETRSPYHQLATLIGSLTKMMTESRTKNPAGTVIGIRVPPKLLARLDSIIARRPDPKPTRAKVIRNLVRQALNARDERKGLRRPAKSATSRASR